MSLRVAELVGGPRDGEWMSVVPDQTVVVFRQLVSNPRKAWLVLEDQPDAEVETIRVVYRLALDAAGLPSMTDAGRYRFRYEPAAAA